MRERACFRSLLALAARAILWRRALQSIFVSYRRSDSEGEAGRLFDELTLHFPHGSIFMDVAAIELGRDFRKAIDQSISSCTVLLAMIGQEWLASKDAQGHIRLQDPNDYVRIELASALRWDIPVVPVLVRGAKMPRPEQLPEDLKELAYRNAVELTHARWKSDVQVLIRALRPYLEDACAGQPEIAPLPRTSEPVAAASAVTLDPAVQERVSRELAAYIGPIAELVVKRAGKRCSTLGTLCEMVAAEIENGADRARFLKSCRG